MTRLEIITVIVLAVVLLGTLGLVADHLLLAPGRAQSVAEVNLFAFCLDNPPPAGRERCDSWANAMIEQHAALLPECDRLGYGDKIGRCFLAHGLWPS